MIEAQHTKVLVTMLFPGLNMHHANSSSQASYIVNRVGQGGVSEDDKDVSQPWCVIRPRLRKSLSFDHLHLGLHLQLWINPY